jgi:pimeloyl-ACP methyl ester carboxylesterase
VVNGVGSAINDADDAPDPIRSLDLTTIRVPPPDPTIEPDGFVVTVDSADRIHFLDWGLASGSSHSPIILLIHGLNQTGWAWAPVARRLCHVRRIVAMDLRGHGLSDAPTHGYDPGTLAEDSIAVGEAVSDAADRAVVVGHGFGAVVAAWTAARLGDRCAGLVLVDGGWEDIGRDSGMSPDEFLRTIEEPPEVLRSIGAFLADRRGYDPATWDADQERAARATVVEVPAGHVVAAVRPHVLAGMVEAMLAYDPLGTLPAVSAPIMAIEAGEDEDGSRAQALAAADGAVRAAGRPGIRLARIPGSGHNLMRYRPVDVAAAILAVERIQS